MEVAGLVVGIVGLYTACQSCYSLYTESKSAQQNVNAALHDLQIHKSILKAWAFYWEIPESLIDRKNTGDQSERVCPKLEWYLKRYPDKAIGIASALQRTGDVLSDRERLLSAYGLEASLQYAHITVRVFCWGRTSPENADQCWRRAMRRARHLQLEAGHSSLRM